jgi:hypothetical protein
MSKKSAEYGAGIAIRITSIGADACGSGGEMFFERINPAGSSTVQNPRKNYEQKFESSKSYAF